jgi:Zn-dependent peptidase ImmA (M78 family)
MNSGISEAIHKARVLRVELGIGTNEPVNIFDLLRYRENISIIKIKLSEQISGFIVKKGSAKAIVINSEMSLGRQIFTAAHEYFHLKYDDDFENYSDEKEKMADEFASHFLMPDTALENIIYERAGDKKIKHSDIVYIENYFKMSHRAVLKRLRASKYIKEDEFKRYSEMSSKDGAVKFGYSTELYVGSRDEEIIFSNYRELAETALEENKISKEKYEKYIFDSGLENIVLAVKEETV